MSVKWEGVTAGDELWDCHKYKMGNTACRRMGSWLVKVIDINHAEGWALASWNHNAPQKMFRRQIERLRRSPARERP